jgi:hypothetical protein
LLFSHSPAASFLTPPAFGSFSRGLPGHRVLPDALSLLSASRRFQVANSTFILNPARVARTVLICSSNQSLVWQLRFIQARNLPELLHSARNGFSSPLAAGSSFAFGARERAREPGEFCLCRSPFGWF